MTIRVVLADDQEMVRTGFRMILEATDEITVVGEAADGQAAVDLCRRLRPDVALLDIRMPGLDGLEATRRLAGPDVADPVRVVVVTTFDLDEYVHAALLNGATGFLLKDAGPALLVEAVRAAARGDALVSPQVTTRLLRHLSTSAGARRAAVEPSEPLTSREEEALALVARGLTNAEIGERLYVSVSTVKTHLGSLHAKLGARNRVELAAWAWQSGRMDEEGPP
jgi:DNA-binding NarL/FixJ family response regulator